MDTSTLLQVARETISKVTWCFVVTSGPDGTPNARIVRPGPLREDWSIGFMTERTCRKVREIERAGRFAMAFQFDPELAYVTLQGEHQIVADVNVKRAVWSAESQRFHPGGPEDPNVVIVRLRTDRIELYNGTHGVQPKPVGLCSVVLARSGDGWLQHLTSPRDAA
jgi:general stress protein 26